MLFWVSRRFWKFLFVFAMSKSNRQSDGLQGRGSMHAMKLCAVGALFQLDRNCSLFDGWQGSRYHGKPLVLLSRSNATVRKTLVRSWIFAHFAKWPSPSFLARPRVLQRDLYLQRRVSGLHPPRPLFKAAHHYAEHVLVFNVAWGANSKFRPCLVYGSQNIPCAKTGFHARCRTGTG